MYNNKYIGMRYVPKFHTFNDNTSEWTQQKSSTTQFENLEIVTYQGNSYTSKQIVPMGIDINNSLYWACTGNFNAQLAQIEENIGTINDNLNNITTTIKNFDSIESNTNYKFNTPTLTINSTIILNGLENIQFDFNHFKLINNTSGDMFKLINCTNISFVNLYIDNSGEINSNTQFHLIGCNQCNISQVELSGNYRSIFAVIENGSKYCNVRNCYGHEIYRGFIIGNNGDNNSINIEPDGNPTSYCTIDSNIIVNYVEGAITTRTRNNEINTINGKVFHRIQNNLSINGNHNNLYTNSICIEIWSSYCTIEGNTCINDDSHPSLIGISLARCCYCSIINNKIFGNFSYQGIELASVSNTVISTNVIDGVMNTSGNSACIGLGIAGTPQSNAGDSISNIIVDNQFTNSYNGIFFTYPDDEVLIAKYTIIENNNFDNITNYGIYIVDGFSKIVNNNFYNCGYGVFLTGGTNTIPKTYIISNNFYRTINNCIKCENAQGQGNTIIIESNYFYGWHLSAIMLKCPSSYINTNTFEDDGRDKTGWVVSTCGILKSYGYGVVAHEIKNNKCINCTLSVDTISGDYIGINLNNYDQFYTNLDWLDKDNNILMPQNSAPVSGTYTKGTMFYAKDVSVLGFNGMVYNGTTWKGFGAIQV